MNKAIEMPMGADLVIEAVKAAGDGLSVKDAGEGLTGRELKAATAAALKAARRAALEDPVIAEEVAALGKAGGPEWIRMCREVKALGVPASTMEALRRWGRSGEAQTSGRGGDEKGQAEAVDPAELEIPTLDDDGNAKRWVAMFGDDFRYVVGVGWYRWEESRWVKDDVGAAVRMARDIGDEIAGDAEKIDALATAATLDGQGGTARGLTKLAAEIKDWARVSRMLPRLSAMVSLAQTDPAVCVRVDALDADPWLLGVDNGVVDLRTGTFREARREDLITKVAGCAYDQAATCPTWDRFLTEAQPDARVRDFLTRLAGYWATGAIRDHILPIFVGSGANGKGVFLETVCALLGDYARPMPSKLWTNAEGEHPTLLMGLRGTRFAPSQETPMGAKIDDGTLKNLSGGDRISARGMRQDYVEFAPTHKLCLATNARPIIVDASDGIWRRLAPIEWPVSFKGREDTGLTARLKAELPGLLNLIIAGCLDWQGRGMQIPAPILEAREPWRETSDPFRDFLREECVRDGEVTRSELYNSYAKWAEGTGKDDRGQGLKALGQRHFAERLRAEGFTEKANVYQTGKMSRARGWVGLRLKTEAERQAEAGDDEAACQAALERAQRVA